MSNKYYLENLLSFFKRKNFNYYPLSQNSSETVLIIPFEGVYFPSIELKLILNMKSESLSISYTIIKKIPQRSISGIKKITKRIKNDEKNIELKINDESNLIAIKSLRILKDPELDSEMIIRAVNIYANQLDYILYQVMTFMES